MHCLEFQQRHKQLKKGEFKFHTDMCVGICNNQNHFILARQNMNLRFAFTIGKYVLTVLSLFFSPRASIFKLSLVMACPGGLLENVNENPKVESSSYPLCDLPRIISFLPFHFHHSLLL